MSEFSARSGASETLPPQMAGRFYPTSAAELAASVEGYLSKPIEGFAPKLIVSPHAGLPFCGDLIGKAFSAVKHGTSLPTSVVLLGPSHHHAIKGCIIPAVDTMTSVLGQSPVVTSKRQTLSRIKGVYIDNAPFVGEHSVDVLLPWVHHTFGNLPVLPVLVGHMSADQIRSIMQVLWGDPDCLIIVSSDLSHFLQLQTAQSLDDETLSALERMQHQTLVSKNACGYAALRTAWEFAAPFSMRVTRLGQNTSAKVTNDPNRVVGYGAMVMEYDHSARLTSSMRHYLLETARAHIHAAVTGTPPRHIPDQNVFGLRSHRATFVTINKKGRLRGCIGSLAPQRALLEDVIHNARAAATHDPRFKPVTPDELPDLTIDLSILGIPAPMSFANESDLLRQLNPDQDGLIFSSNGKRATYLPHVWSQIPSAAAFLQSLKQKAGLKPDHWSEDVRVWRYGAEVFGESHQS